MAQIDVTHDAGDDFLVRVREGGGSSEHTVTVTDEHLERFGAGASKEELLEASFRFLLDREPKEAILSSFELPAIERYFPEYPREVGRRLEGG